MTLDASDIHDADLLEELTEAHKKTKDPFLTKTLLRSLEHRQQERDRIAALPRDKRRRLQAHANLVDTPDDAQDLRHIHSVLAICGLPYKKQPLEIREYERRQGRMSLVVEAGKLRDPATGDRIPQPLPYGPKSRLLLMHTCTEAIRQKNPTIEIADTLTGFIEDMGFPVTGGKKGTLPAFKQQINSLAACKMSIGTWNGRKSTEVQGTPFSKVDLWLPENADQRMLWPSTLTLSLDFFESMSKHALPLRSEAVRAFAGSSLKLDMYFWISHRLFGLEKPLFLSWNALAAQFGGSFSRPRDFRASFRDDVDDMLDVFPKLPLTLSEEGLMLSPADGKVLMLPERKKQQK